MLQRYEKICTRAIIKENFFLIGNWGAALLLFRGRAEPYCLEDALSALQKL